MSVFRFPLSCASFSRLPSFLQHSSLSALSSLLTSPYSICLWSYIKWKAHPGPTILCMLIKNVRFSLHKLFPFPPILTEPRGSAGWATYTSHLVLSRIASRHNEYILWRFLHAQSTGIFMSSLMWHAGFCLCVHLIKFSAFRPQRRTSADSDADFLMSPPRKYPRGWTEEIPLSLNATHYLMCPLLLSY